MQTKFDAKGISHILDDFIFIGPPDSPECLLKLNQFLELCSQINIPIKKSKTFTPSEKMVVHGIEIDTLSLELKLPNDKLIKLKDILCNFKFRKKCTLKELQSLVGHLNFACKAVLPGRVFKRRISRLMAGVTKQFHHINLTHDFRCDVNVWLEFLDTFNGRSLLLDEEWNTSSKLEFFSDASGVAGAAILGDMWFSIKWPEKWNENSIAALELSPIVIGLEIWAHLLKNQRILFLVDNMSVVDVINKQSSKDKIILSLLRRLVLNCLKYNIVFRAKHVPGIENNLADNLSRCKFQAARLLRPTLQTNQSSILRHQLPWNRNT